MPPCDNRTCQLQVSTLQKLIDQERKLHLAEVQKIQQSVECFSRIKSKQCEEMRVVVDRMADKLEKYKKKCCNLNEKTKQYLDTIKSLRKRITLLEESISIVQTQKHAQKQIVLEQLKIGSELRQVISLQETQIQQLYLKIRFLEERNQQLYSQLQQKTDALSKIKNADNISEDQYQRQMILLRENLKLEFTKNTNDIISTFSSGHWDTDIKQIREEPKDLLNQAEEELLVLANYMEFNTQKAQRIVSLPSSKSILMFWQNLLKEKYILESDNQKLKQIKQQLTEEMREKLNYIEQLIAVKQIKTFEIGIQTPKNDVADQLLSMNSFYRIKLLEMQEILSLQVYFSAYLLNLLSYSHKKIVYFQKIAQGKLKKAEKKSNNKFRSVALAVLFAQILRKKASKQKKNFQNTREILNDHQWKPLLLKCISQRQSYTRKNPVLDELMSQKAKTSKQDVLITFSKLLGEETIGLTLSKVGSEHLHTYDIHFC